MVHSVLNCNYSRQVWKVFELILSGIKLTNFMTNLFLIFKGKMKEIFVTSKGISLGSKAFQIEYEAILDHS